MSAAKVGTPGENGPLPPAPAQPLGPNARFLLAAAAVVAILAMGWLTYAQAPRQTWPPYANYPPDKIFYGKHELNRLLVHIITNTDSASQVAAHKVMLLTTAVLGLTALVWPARWRPRNSLLMTAAAALVVVGLGVVLWRGWKWQAPWAGYLLGALLVGAGYGAAWGSQKRGWNLLLGAVALLAILAAFLPGLFYRFDFSDHPWDAIERIEMHHVLLLSQGDRLAAGFPLFDDIAPHYGVGLPVLTGIAQRAGLPLSIHKYHLLLEITQAVYVIALSVAYWYYGRKRWLVALPFVVFLAVVYHFNHQNLPYPNHLAWRFLGFGIAALALIACRRSAITTAVVALGASAGVCMLLNPETGIAITIAFVVYILFRYGGDWQGYRLVHWSLLGVRFLAGGVLSLVVFCLLYRVGLGVWPDLIGFGRLYGTLLFFANTGYAGLQLEFDPLALLIFAHAAYVLVRGWAERPARPHFFLAMRLALAAMILVWFSYYANAPQPKKIYTLMALYGFLLVDILRSVAAVRTRRLASLPVWAGAAVLCVIVVPYCVPLMAQEYAGYRAGLKALRKSPPPEGALRVSGVYLPNDLRTARLVEKADYVRTLAEKGPVAYCSINSYLIPKVADAWPALPLVDAYWESVTRERYEALLTRLHGFETVLLDSEESIADGPPPQGVRVRNELSYKPFSDAAREFYAYFRKDLARDFVREGVVHGWEVWRRRGPE